jgi:glycosyltransferase involved in cell wall biosynthesis
MSDRDLDGRRIAFVQHGDYAEAVDRFESGQGETYFAQRYSVSAVADLVEQGAEVSVLCVASEPYDRQLSNGVRAIGRPVEDRDAAPAIDVLTELKPTDVVLRTPRSALLAWALRQGVRTLPMLADSIRPGVRRWWSNRRLARALNHPQICWVGNHNINSSNSLRGAGVDPAKVIPWDWPMSARPEDYPPKRLPQNGSRQVIFVGVQSHAKGLGDVISAVGRLRHQGIDVSLTSVGGGNVEPFRSMAENLQIQEHVTFTGRVEHGAALKLMREHDAVLVPSRHEYSEGLPMTIYDGLTTRTPLVVSDHPMFRGKVEHGVSGLVFRASQATELADRLQMLLTDAVLYERLSSNAVEAFRRIECPAKWGDVITRWLRASDEDQRWLGSYALSTGRYA